MRDRNRALNEGGKSPALEKLKSEKAAVEEQLRIARDERAKLQRDINAIQQQAESSWATERMENALLRERINDIAAEVAKLAMQLEGPNSPIEAMLAARPGGPGEAGKTRQRRRRQWRGPRPARLQRAAARSPNASARCSPTPPAPASRGRDPPASAIGLTPAPALRKSRPLTRSTGADFPAFDFAQTIPGA